MSDDNMKHERMGWALLVGMLAFFLVLVTGTCADFQGRLTQHMSDMHSGAKP